MVAPSPPPPSLRALTVAVVVVKFCAHYEGLSLVFIFEYSVTVCGQRSLPLSSAIYLSPSPCLTCKLNANRFAFFCCCLAEISAKVSFRSWR